MKKLIAIIVSLVLLLTPLTCVAYAEGEASPTDQLTDVLSGPIETIKSLFQPLTDLFNKISEIVTKILNSMGYYAGTGGDDYKPREWETDNSPQYAYAGLISEFNSVLANTASSTSTCVIDKNIRSSYTTTENSKGNLFNSTTLSIIKKSSPESESIRVTTSDEGINAADYIIPKNCTIDISKVKSADRKNNYNGTATITLIMYSENYTDTSYLAQNLTKTGIMSRDELSSVTFSLRDFNAHNDSIKVEITYNLETELLVNEIVDINSYYDICGTVTLTDTQQTTGWAYYDVNTYITTTFRW